MLDLVSRRPTTVRVGIVSWNSAEPLEACLAALPAALEGCDAEVVVVDNASSDHSAAVAERHNCATVIRSPLNEGYARAMNRALAGPDVEILVALNPDTVPGPRSLSRLVAKLESQPDVGLVAPRLVHGDGSLQHSVYRFPSPITAAAEHLLWNEPTGGLRRRRWYRGTLQPDGSGDVDWAIGAVHVMRARALAGEAPYRERWFMYTEDMDLCWRLARAGWRRRLEPSVSVMHVGNASGRLLWSTDPSVWTIAGFYDWYGMVYSTRAARGWAMLNIAGALMHGALLAARSFTGARVDRRTRALVLWRHLPLHLRVVLFGPPPPVGPPDATTRTVPALPVDPWRWRHGRTRDRHGCTDSSWR